MERYENFTLFTLQQFLDLFAKEEATLVARIEVRACVRVRARASPAQLPPTHTLPSRRNRQASYARRRANLEAQLAAVTAGEETVV